MLAASILGFAIPSRAAPVKAQDYYEDFAAADCSDDGATCVATFPALDAETFILTHLRCNIHAFKFHGSTVLFTVLVSGNGHDTYLIGRGDLTPSSPGNYQVTEQLVKLFSTGHAPAVRVTFRSSARPNQNEM